MMTQRPKAVQPLKFRQEIIGFSQAEIDQLREGYTGGAVGEVLIALQSTRRLLTCSLAPRPTEGEAVEQMRRTAKSLFQIKVDGWLWCRPARIRGSADRIAILFHESVLVSETHRVERIMALDQNAILLHLRGGDLDRVAQSLRHVLQVGQGVA